MVLVLECNPNSSVICAEAPVELKQERFFDDRLRIYERLERLPPAEGEIVRGRIHIVGRQQFLAWARYLGKPIRIAVTGDATDLEDLGPDVQVLTRDDLLREEEEDFTKPAWQLYRFGRSLTDSEKESFRQAVADAVIATGRIKLESSLQYFDSDRAVEFLVFIPPFDHESAKALLRAVLWFHSNVVPVIGFQGRESRFPK